MLVENMVRQRWTRLQISLLWECRLLPIWLIVLCPATEPNNNNTDAERASETQSGFDLLVSAIILKYIDRREREPSSSEGTKCDHDDKNESFSHLGATVHSPFSLIIIFGRRWPNLLSMVEFIIAQTAAVATFIALVCQALFDVARFYLVLSLSLCTSFAQCV